MGGAMNNDVWVWIDLEMTGLEVEHDQIIEVACILTAPDLHPMDPKPFLSVVHQSDEVLKEMSEWCQTHHGSSGLTEEVRNSRKSIAEVELELIQYLDRVIVGDPTLYLSGNSIGTDRTFIKKYMPILESRLHYRMIDVTSVKLVVNAFFPNISVPVKQTSHRAEQDIMDSIEELRYYVDFMKSR